MIKNILLAFIPVFVAVDAPGVLPIFASLTRGFTREEKAKVINQSVATAICLAVGFIFLGKFIFRALGITMSDFMVAGGAVLFCIAIIDIITPGKKRRIPGNELGAVPLGTPLIVGPAVMTASLIIIDDYGLYVALISVISNVLVAGFIFYSSDTLLKVVGETGVKALSKVMHLLLAAIAVMFIRKGITQLLG
ncbi:MAG: MarC family protein [Candidatus Omnitrophota bacterium]